MPNGLVLVRHAPTAWSGRRYSGTSDPPLDDAGEAIARDLAAVLAPTLPDGVRLVSSPRRRALATAAAIASALGRVATEIEVDARWAETDFGIVEGRTFAELQSMDPGLARRLAAGDVDIEWPGGEPAAAFAARVAAAWTELTERREATVVVSHAGPIRQALALAARVPPASVGVPLPGESRWLPFATDRV